MVRGSQFPSVILSAALCILSAGCGPDFTYPAETVPQAIEKICLEEYQIPIQARVVGKTAGALLDTNLELDMNGQITKDVNEKMGKVMQVVTRVGLSTDAPIDFCVVFLRDKKQGAELVITRYLDDIKRANAEVIGVEETINRTLFGQNKLAPGADPFVLKEIKLENFLAQQIAQRIKISFSRDQKDSKDETLQPLALVDGHFIETQGKRIFRFSLLSLKSEDPKELMMRVFKVVNDVLGGYHFTLFDELEIQDYLNRQKLVLDQKTMQDYQQNKITTTEIIKRFLVESSSLQEAFKLFGFSSPQEPTTAPNP